MLYRSVTKQILKDLAYFPAVGIIGPRQVGKTTLAKSIQKTLQLDTLYLDLELETDYRKLSDAEAFLRYHENKCIIIDEIQRMPALFPLLRALIDIDRKPARFILLGSSTPAIIKDSSETLAGRIAYTELTPFSLLEIADKFTMEEHWLKGGFPQALLSPEQEQTTRWLKSFIDTFIYRDLQDLGHPMSPKTVDTLLSMLAALNGHTLNISDLARSIGISQSAINRYLDLLEGGFVIQRLQPYFANVSKRLVKAPKVYVRDSGILHSISNVTTYDQLLGHPMVGLSWEGYVIEQIKRVTDSSWKFYFYRTHKGAEADLVIIAPNGKKVCVEIKLSTSPTVSRGYYETLADLEPDYKFIIIPKGDSYPKDNGVMVCSLDSFLRDQLPTINLINPSTAEKNGE